MFRVVDASTSLRQAEILSNVVEHQVNLTSLKNSSNGIKIDRREHPYAIVLTQDCDLDWDYRSRYGSQRNEAKLIPAVLFCEVVEASQIRHRADINSQVWKKIKVNKDERYQFISETPMNKDLKNQGLPELGIDFKRYFTVPCDELYWQIEAGICNRRTQLMSPYIEHLSHRFCNFLSRIALPQDYESSPPVSKP